MTDLVARLREAIDAEAQDVELSISIEIENLRADGGTVVTREQILAWDAEEEGGGPYTRRLRRCAADRKMLDLHAPSEYRISHGGIPRTVLQCEHCSDLCHSRSGLACDDPCDAVYPCETVQIVAEFYQVEA